MYNFGLSEKPFDLSFALNMLRGRMDFTVGALDSSSTLDFYREVENRTIVEQVFDLDAPSKKRLIAALERAAGPGESDYNYRFFADNCATRPAALLRLTAGEDSPPFAAYPSKTIRSSVDEVLGKRAWLRLAVDCLLGPRADRRIPMGPIFLPEDLMKWAARATIGSVHGAHALVSETRVLYEAKPEPRRPLLPSPLEVSLAILAIAILASAFQSRAARAARVFDLVLFCFAVLPFISILVFRFSARYEEVGGNLNLLWATPVPLAALALSRGGPRRATPRALFALAALAAAAISAGGGYGWQSVPAEVRLLAAAVALRCAFRPGLLDAHREDCAPDQSGPIVVPVKDESSSMERKLARSRPAAQITVK